MSLDGEVDMRHRASDEAALGIARTYHRSVLQPEPNASPHDGPVGQLAEATTLDLLGGGA